jgi:hypothetical protein
VAVEEVVVAVPGKRDATTTARCTPDSFLPARYNRQETNLAHPNGRIPPGGDRSPTLRQQVVAGAVLLALVLTVGWITCVGGAAAVTALAGVLVAAAALIDSIRRS